MKPKIQFEEEEPGGASSFISTYCGVAIDRNMSMCGGARSRASDCSYAVKKSRLNTIIQEVNALLNTGNINHFGKA